NLVRDLEDALLYRRGILRAGGRRSTRRADPKRPGLGTGRERRASSRGPTCRGGLDIESAAPSVSGAAALWASPAVLWNRSDQGKTAVGACPGGGIPDRARNRRDADDLHDLQRHLAHHSVDRLVGASRVRLSGGS